MRFFLILALLFASGCTSITYTSPNGRSLHWMSFKEYQSIDIEIGKDGDDVLAEVHAVGVNNDAAKEVAGVVVSGVLKGMGISSSASVVKEVVKGLVQKKIAESKKGEVAP